MFAERGSISCGGNPHVIGSSDFGVRDFSLHIDALETGLLFWHGEENESDYRLIPTSTACVAPGPMEYLYFAGASCQRIVRGLPIS